MAKLIDTQKALEIVRFECGEWTGLAKTIENRFNELPSVEAEPVRHGRWIDETFKPTGLVFHPYVCDQCGCHSESNFTYCPDCGARMDGEQDG